MELDKKIHPDYLLIKEIPGAKVGSILTIGNNYLYYIKEESNDNYKRYEDDWVPWKDSLLRFNIYTIENNPDFFLKIDEMVIRDMKISSLLD